MGTRNRILDAIGSLERWTGKLPGPAREAVEHALAPLRTVLLELPVVAVAVVGGRRADRVWLGGVLAGSRDAPWSQDDEGWWVVEGPRGVVRVWDADTCPAPEAPEAVPMDRVAPVALLALPGAGPGAVGSLMEILQARHEVEIPVLGLLGRQAPGGGIARVVEARSWARALQDGGLDGVDVVDPHGPDGVDAMVGKIVGLLEPGASLALLRTSGRRALVEARARSLVTAAATAASAIAATPLPVADSVPLGALQLVLVLGIARLSGRPATLASARELVGAAGVQLGGAVAFREVARALVKVVPGWGSAVSAGIAWAGTAAIGEAAIAWFVFGMPQSKVRRLLARRAERDGADADEG